MRRTTHSALIAALAAAAAAAAGEPPAYVAIDLGDAAGLENLQIGNVNDAVQVGACGGLMCAWVLERDDEGGWAANALPYSCKTFHGLGKTPPLVTNGGLVVQNRYEAYTMRATIWRDGVSAGSAPAWARGVGDADMVVGDSGLGAYVWQSGVLETIEPGEASAQDANALGHVVGARVVDGTIRAVLWTRAGDSWDALDLGTLGGRFTVARAINDEDVIVGASFIDDSADPIEHAFVWRDGVMTDLGTLPGFDRSNATDINKCGEIVGTAYTAGPPFTGRGVLWVNGVAYDLNDLVVGGAPGTITWPTSINAHGVITTSHLLLVPVRAADLDGDGAVGMADLLGLLATWGACPGGDPGCAGDIDGDGAIGGADLALLIDGWTGCR